MNHHRARKFAWPALLLCGSATLLGGCRGGALPDLRGRYAGQETDAGGPHPIVALIPAREPVSRGFRLRFDIFRALGSAQAQPFSVLMQKDQAVLRYAPLGPADVTLAIQGDCAHSAAAADPVTFCWSDERLKLESPRLVLTLERGDALPPADPAAPDAAYTLDELAGRARFRNYAVAEEAERVFQAREAIRAAVGDLLPHLNVRDVLAFAANGYLGIIEAAGDLLPFLFPSNWYRWAEDRALYQAERQSFASLRGNEINAVEVLFYGILRDQAVQELLERHLAWTKKLQAVLVTEEAAGTLSSGSADYFGLSVNELAQDLIQIRALVQSELAAMAHAVALPAVGGLGALVPVALPDLSLAQPLDAATFYREAQLKSLELATLGALLTASQRATGETAFAFLDPASSGAIGFGLPATIRISRSRTAEIRTRIDETSSLIEARSSQVAAEMNQAAQSYSLADASARAARSRFEWLLARHRNGDLTLGDPEFVDKLIEWQRKILILDSGRLSSQHAFAAAQARLNRLLLQGYYRDLESEIPQGE